jgi:hypothetical protein
VPDEVVYGFGWMDEPCRVADRAMTSALGWPPGDRLTFTAAAGVVIARRDPAGMVTMSAKPYLVIPARCAAASPAQRNPVTGCRACCRAGRVPSRGRTRG